MEMWARAYARTAGWERARIREGLNFRPFKQEYERRAEEQRRQATQARAALRGMRVVQGGRRDRTQPPGEESLSAEMAPSQKVESESLFLIAVGTLELRRRGRIWFDNFHKRYMTNWSGHFDDAVIPATKRTDAFDRGVFAWLQQVDHRLAKISPTMITEAISYVADRDERNEAADWIRSIEWDGVDRLTTLLPEAFKTEDDDYHRAVGRCWFVSMAARILDPGCKVDTMPVFMGAQGRQKSQALEIIGGSWYRAASSTIDSANFLQELHGCLVFEVPELHSIIASKHGAARVKAVLSTRIDNFRPPYGRHVAEYKRTAVLAGTTNERGWHNDSTGGRRFWPVVTPESIDLEWLQRNRAQLFAEAAKLYAEGAPWWDVPEEEQARRIEAERHVDPWEDVLIRSLSHESLYDGWNAVVPDAGDNSVSENANFGSLITTTRIGVQWLRMTPEQTSRSARKIAEIMRGLGWHQVKLRAQNSRNPVRFWVRLERPVEAVGGTDFGLGGTDSEVNVARLDEDVPF
jgi:putative DNA primase/helicase